LGGGWPGALDFPLKQKKIVDFFRIQKGADEPQPAKCGLPQGNFAFLGFNGSLIVGSWTNHTTLLSAGHIMLQCK
jgi:hypothetical protein